MGVPKTQVSVLIPWRNGLKASRTRLFSSFFVKYLPYLMIFQSCENVIKKSSIMGGKNLAKKPSY